MAQIAILGHSTYSYCIHPAGNGEMANARVLASHLRTQGHEVQILDVFEQMGIERLAELDQVESFPEVDADLQFLLTYPGVLATLLRLDVHKRAPTITRIYAFDDFSSIQPHIHMQVDLCMTQNLTANELALEQGVRPDQLLYIPYQELPEPMSESERIAFKHDYFAKRFGREPQGKIVGCAVRMRCGKNVEYLLDAFREVRQQLPETSLFIKGVLDGEWDMGQCIDYTPQLKNKLESFKHEPWFFWDNSLSPHEEQLKILQLIDFGVYPTGADDPPNVVVEQLAMGTPTLLLDGEPRRTLFGGAAQFCNHQGYHRIRRCAVPFLLPDFEDLKGKIVQLFSVKAHPHAHPRALILRRFGPEVTARKLPLLLEGACQIHHKTELADHYRRKLLEEQVSDYTLFYEPKKLS